MAESPADFLIDRTRLLGFDHINHWMTWLRSLGSRDPELSYGNLVSISGVGIPDDLMEQMILQMERAFLRLSDVDRAINNLQRFIQSCRSPLSLATLFSRDASALPILLQLFSDSQHCSDLLIQSPHYYDHLRLTSGLPRSRQDLIRDISEETATLSDPAAIPRALLRFKHRETLRIAYGDIVLGLPLETTAQQISHVADAVCQAAYEAARRQAESGRKGVTSPSSMPMCILAMGKLGGTELNYSSDIDLVFVYDSQPPSAASHQTTPSPQTFFDDVARRFLRFLSDPGQSGSIYRVDMRLRPDGNSGLLTQDRKRFLSYYENRGRTWERQALLKARVAAGDPDLGWRILGQLQPWLYRKFLTRFEIESIRTLKHKIEHRATSEGHDQDDVKTGHGGIRDVEFVIQFLQLLHAAHEPSIRTGNTLEAIGLLQRCDCLTLPESTLLQRNYRLLRLVEHRLQLMFDLQTHRLPAESWELRKLALRCGFTGDESGSALDHFQRELKEVRSSNRRILNHLLHQAFPDTQGQATMDYSETDLILDPSPARETIQQTLAEYHLGDPESAYRRLKELSQETSRFLSDQRCRHFFAAICRPLLKRVSLTPNPSETLTELSRVADSLGNKGVLWELFSSHPASMDLCVRLCSVAPYLTSILTGNPGMLDELLDSLLLDHLPDREQLHHQLSELLRGAEDPIPILHSFKDAMHLLVGARDVLGKGVLQQSHQFLSDVAETCLVHILDHHYRKTVEKWGQPLTTHQQPMPWAVIALGKLGGQEPNYHSDLDLAFVYWHDGTTQSLEQGSPTTSHQHFFSRFASQAFSTLSHFGPQGKLYEVDCRLRPTGKAGSLAVSLPQLETYFGLTASSNRRLKEGQAQLWERQTLCKARVLCPNQSVGDQIRSVLLRAIQAVEGKRQTAESIYQMRLRMQHGSGPWNLKRGMGGTIDIEFAVQLLQLLHAKHHPQIVIPNTLAAISELVRTQLLSPDDGHHFAMGYQFLREMESRLRLLNGTARHDLPDSETELNRLAYLLRIRNASQLRETVPLILQENRTRFRKLVSQYCDLPD